MKKNPVFHCYDSALEKRAEPFELTPGVEEADNFTKLPVILEAGRICLTCPQFEKCEADATKWALGLDMENWEEFGEEELPAVHGGQVVWEDDKGRHIASVGSDYTSPRPVQKSPAKTQTLTPSPARRRVQKDISVALDDTVQYYLAEIGRVPLLEKEDEVRLSKLVQAGLDAKERLKKEAETLSDREIADLKRQARQGDTATEEFVSANLRLVVSIARRYAYKDGSMDMTDLIQEGNLGLMHAVEKFDWQKGFKFSTYATWWIKQAITRAIANQDETIRLPVHAHESHKKYQKALIHFANNGVSRPTPEELATYLHWPVEQVVKVQGYRSLSTVSLSRPLGEEGDSELGDLVEDKTIESPEDQAIKTGLSTALAHSLMSLSPKEREILTQRYGLDGHGPMTLEEVGYLHNLTRERIRQICTRAEGKLRHPSVRAKLSGYL